MDPQCGHGQSWGLVSAARGAWGGQWEGKAKAQLETCTAFLGLGSGGTGGGGDSLLRGGGSSSSQSSVSARLSWQPGPPPSQRQHPCPFPPSPPISQHPLLLLGPGQEIILTWGFKIFNDLEYDLVSLRLPSVVPCPAYSHPRAVYAEMLAPSLCKSQSTLHKAIGGTLYSQINPFPTAGIQASMIKSIKTFLSQSPVLFKSIAFHNHSLHKQILGGSVYSASRTLPLGNLQHSSPQCPHSVLSLDVSFSERMFRHHSSESTFPAQYRHSTCDCDAESFCCCR